jgi:hypothetical protein
VYFAAPARRLLHRSHVRKQSAEQNRKNACKKAKEKIKMKTIEKTLERPSFWQLVFSQSKANGAPYNGEQLPGRIWDWPKDTYLRRRLHESKSKWYQTANRAELN